MADKNEAETDSKSSEQQIVQSARDAALPGQEGRTEPIDPHDVQDRRQLNVYLSQSSMSEYRDRSKLGEIAQKSTYVKSYIVESHAGNDGHGRWSQVFSQVLDRRDRDLLLLLDQSGVAYFADLSDPRFVIVHTIGRTDATDSTFERLTQGGVEGFDRAWLPTDFLLGTRIGPLRGFKFGHQAAVAGIAILEEDIHLAQESDDGQVLGADAVAPTPNYLSDVQEEPSDESELVLQRHIVSRLCRVRQEESPR